MWLALEDELTNHTEEEIERAWRNWRRWERLKSPISAAVTMLIVGAVIAVLGVLLIGLLGLPRWASAAIILVVAYPVAFMIFWPVTGRISSLLFRMLCPQYPKGVGSPPEQTSMLGTVWPLLLAVVLYVLGVVWLTGEIAGAP